MEQKIFLREKGLFFFQLEEETLITYDPLIRVVQQKDEILAIQFQATFDESIARSIEEANIFPNLQLPPPKEFSSISIDVYLDGNQMLREHLAWSLKEEPFINPVEGVVYFGNPYIPILNNIESYNLLKYEIFINV